MFFLIKEILKSKKKINNNKSKENIENNNINENTKKDCKDNNTKNNKDSKNNNKKKYNYKNDKRKVLKENKQQGLSNYKKNKLKYKKLKKEKKKAKKEIKRSKFPIYYRFILTLLVFVVSLNICINIFSKGFKIEGSIVCKDNKYFFIPKLSELRISEHNEFKNLKKGDTIYICYNKKRQIFEYSLEKKFLKNNIKGTIYRKTDYFMYIDFDFKNEINYNSYYLEKFEEGEEITIILKKFLFKYIIDENIKDVIYYGIK